MKLKILHLTQFLGVGGLEKVLFLLIQEQLKAGHDVELVVYDYEQTWVEYFRKNGIKVNTSYSKTEGYDRKLLGFIASLLPGVDVLHTHDLNPLMYAAPLKFLHTLRLKKFPRLIHSAHGMDHLHKRPVTKLYEKLCSFMTNSTIGVSTAVCDYYLNLGLSRKKVININNGTQILEYQDQKENARQKLRQSFQIQEDQKIWVSVARVVPLKDQKILCDFAAQTPGNQLLIIGPSGDDQYWKDLMENKPANVHMPGSRSDINEILLGSDYFISASRHEGIPVSVLEAGAVGIPCLLSDIPGHKVIQNGSHENVALYFKTGDLLDLQLKAEQLKNNKSLASSLGTALHKHVKENFSSETMYKRYLEVYLGNQCSKS